MSHLAAGSPPVASTGIGVAVAARPDAPPCAAAARQPRAFRL